MSFTLSTGILVTVTVSFADLVSALAVILITVSGFTVFAILNTLSLLNLTPAILLFNFNLAVFSVAWTGLMTALSSMLLPWRNFISFCSNETDSTLIYSRLSKGYSLFVLIYLHVLSKSQPLKELADWNLFLSITTASEIMPLSKDAALFNSDASHLQLFIFPFILSPATCPRALPFTAPIL